LQRMGEVPEADMRRTFNLGIGMILVVAPGERAAVERHLRRHGEEPIPLGQIVAAAAGARVRFKA
ncbi:MAG TPA: hypothetical protein VIC54_12135, partial [Terriglobales bacterium]